MTSPTIEKSAAAAKAPMDALMKNDSVPMSGFQTLADAYKDMATRNAHRLTASLKSLSAVKTPTEFFELQQTLIKEGVEAAVQDSSTIANLTAAAFTTAFEPTKKHIEALTDTTTH